ncbi:hypothetical protein ACFLWL_00195 [Chloroflexota bacterium]
MLKIEVKTKLSPEEIIKKAVEFFSTGCGLKVKHQAFAYVSFEGGGGGVEVTVYTKEKGTSVELVSQEWDLQVKEFIRKIS